MLVVFWNDPRRFADYECCGIRGALVSSSAEVLTETPEQPQWDSLPSEAIRVAEIAERLRATCPKYFGFEAAPTEAPTVDNASEGAGRRTYKRAIKTNLCSETYMTACIRNVANHNHAPASAEPGILNVDDKM